MSERWLWTQKEDIGPSPRGDAAMAHEAARQRVVLFGGMDYVGFLNDTWVWDGDDWAQVADMGPSPRWSVGMTYDESRQKLVLFGGGGRVANAYQVLGDTWEWNGTEWMQVADIGPAPRKACALSYDTVRHRVVLFGGTDDTTGVTYNDTWEWDNTEWTQIADTGPPQRAYHAVIFDRERECLVLFGGSGPPSGWRGDTWEWGADAGWVKRQDMGPQAMANPTMAYTGEHTVLVGNLLVGNPQAGGSAMVQTWEWDDRLWTQRQDMGPPPRQGYALAYDSQRDRAVLFGGWLLAPQGGYLGDTWELAIIEQ